MSDKIEKVLTSTHIGADSVGLLEPQQADRFIDLIWDETVISDSARKIRMNSDTVELERLHVGQRLLRVATEAVDDHVNVVPRWSKIEMRSSKLRLDWELSTEALEDSREGEALEDTVARLMAAQIGRDMEDLAINGDSTSTDVLMRAFDGYRKLAMDHGIVISGGDYVAVDPGVNDANSVPADQRGINRAKFTKALRAMDRKYMQQRAQLRFYLGSNLAVGMYDIESPAPDTYVRQAPVNSPTENGYYLSAGIPVFEVPQFRDDLNYAGTAIETTAGAATYGVLELTFPNNRLWGIKREIKVYREFQPKKDTIEYTVFTRVGAQIEEPEAYVVETGIETDPGDA